MFSPERPLVDVSLRPWRTRGLAAGESPRCRRHVVAAESQIHRQIAAHYSQSAHSETPAPGLLQHTKHLNITQSATKLHTYRIK